MELSRPPPDLPIKYIIMNGPMREDFAAKTKESIKNLEDFKDFCFKGCVTKRKLYTYDPVSTPLQRTNEQRYVYTKLCNLQEKYDRVYQKVYGGYLVTATFVLDFIKQQQEQGMCAIGLVKHMHRDMQKELDESKELKRYKFMILSLNSYAKRIEAYTQFPNISLEIVHENLIQSSNNADTVTGYCGQSTFDDVFSIFVRTNKEMYEIMKNFLKPMKEKKQLDLTNINHLYKQVTEIIHVESKSEGVVLRNSIMRFIFDEFYPETFVFDQKCEESLISKMDIARVATPRQLNIPPSLMTEQYMDTPFSELIQAQLYDSVSFLQSASFYVAGNDIVYAVHRTLSALSDFVKSANVEQTYGPFTDFCVDQNSGSSLSFDDCFSLFFPIFCSVPPAGITILSKMISNCKGLRLSSSLDFAKLMLVSVIDYSNEMDAEKIAAEIAEAKENGESPFTL